VNEFIVDTAEMHNACTSISVRGQYQSTNRSPRRGKPTAEVTFGDSKDHRPDLKQLVGILTVSADGVVPMAYRLAAGDTSDDPTHVSTWNQLVKVLGRQDFLYVADSKLCSGPAMRHIDGEGSRFVTVLPPHPRRGQVVPQLDPDQHSAMD
jgi:transposase